MKIYCHSLAIRPFFFAAGLILVLCLGCAQDSRTPSPVPAAPSHTAQQLVATVTLHSATISPSGTPSVAPTVQPSITPDEPALPPHFVARLNLGWVEKIALSPGGDWLAASAASHICLFGTLNLELAWCSSTRLPPEFEIRSSPIIFPLRSVSSLAFHPDGSQLAAALWNGYIIFLDSFTGQPVNVLDTHYQSSIYQLEWSQDGSLIYMRSYESGIEVWDATSGKKVQQLDIDPSTIACAAWSAEKSVLAVGTKEREIILMDLATYDQVTSIQVTSPGNITSLAWSPDENFLYIGTATDLGCSGRCPEDETWIEAWHAATGERLFSTDVKVDIMASLAVSADGRWLAASGGYGTLLVLDGVSGEIETQLTGIDPQSGMTWLGDDRVLFVPFRSNAYGDVRLQSIVQLDMAAGGSAHLLLPGFENIYSFVWLDSQRLLTNSAGGTLSIWQADTAQRLEQFQLMLGDKPLNNFEPTSISLADGWLATTYQASIAIVDVDTRQIVRVMEYQADTPDAHVTASSWSGDGRVLAGVVAEHGEVTVAVWDAHTTQLALTIPVGYLQHITSLALSPDGTRLALGWSSHEGERLVVWDVVADQEHISVEMPGTVWELSWFAENQAAFTINGGLEIWDIAGGEQRARFELGCRYSISPDGTLAAASCGTTGIKLIALRSGDELASLQANDDFYTKLAFSPDGRLLAGLTDHGSLVIWDASPFYP